MFISDSHTFTVQHHCVHLFYIIMIFKLFYLAHSLYIDFFCFSISMSVRFANFCLSHSRCIILSFLCLAVAKACSCCSFKILFSSFIICRFGLLHLSHFSSSTYEITIAFVAFPNFRLSLSCFNSLVKIVAASGHIF